MKAHHLNCWFPLEAILAPRGPWGSQAGECVTGTQQGVGGQRGCRQSFEALDGPPGSWLSSPETENPWSRWERSDTGTFQSCRRGGGRGWDGPGVGVPGGKLLLLEWTSKESLLYSTGTYT